MVPYPKIYLAGWFGNLRSMRLATSVNSKLLYKFSKYHSQHQVKFNVSKSNKKDIWNKE